MLDDQREDFSVNRDTTSASAKDTALDAFIALLVEGGERAASLNAVAERAGLSKGGLLYHFPSKDALVAGLVDRMRQLGAADRERMLAAPEGPIEYYLRTSIQANTPLDAAMLACARVDHGRHREAGTVLGEQHTAWLDTIRTETDSDEAAQAVLLMGDGLYYNSGFTPAETGIQALDIDGIVRIARQFARRSGGDA